MLKPKITIWVNFGGSCKRKCWLILWQFGVFYGQLLYLHTLPFGIFSPFLVRCTNKDLAILAVSRVKNANFFQFVLQTYLQNRNIGPRWSVGRFLGRSRMSQSGTPADSSFFVIAPLLLVTDLSKLFIIPSNFYHSISQFLSILTP
jgi:hypothetical protein